METLSPSQPLSENHGARMSQPGSQPAPENDDYSSHPFAAGSKPHLEYKCLLTQLTQKLRKPPPVFQTQNEGSNHIPRIRCTVCVDGVSYTSSSTFPQRKMAEMDASKLAYIAITQKAKIDALHFIQEDKISCKSIIGEFADKKNIEKPVYETAQLGASVPGFHSNMLFNGVTYSGDNGKSKKEAEQLVARTAIIRYLASESGNDMALVVNCKLRQFHEMNRVQEINSVGQDFGLTEAGTSTMVEPLKPMNLVVSVATQSPTPQVLTELINLVVPVATQLPSSQVSGESVKPTVAESVVLPPVPSAVVNNSSGLVVSPPLVDILTTYHTSNLIQQLNEEALPAQAPEYIPLGGQPSGKKRNRNRNNRKKARKKMRADAQIPVVAANQVPPFSSPE